MKIINIQVDSIDVDFIDVSEVGDPAPGWNRVAAGPAKMRGYGFTESKKERVSLEAVLTVGEVNQFLDLCQRIEQRLVKDA